MSQVVVVEDLLPRFAGDGMKEPEFESRGSPPGARRSTVMAAATTAIARRSMTPMTSYLKRTSGKSTSRQSFAKASFARVSSIASLLATGSVA